MASPPSAAMLAFVRDFFQGVQFARGVQFNELTLIAIHIKCSASCGRTNFFGVQKCLDRLITNNCSESSVPRSLRAFDPLSGVPLRTTRNAMQTRKILHWNFPPEQERASLHCLSVKLGDVMEIALRSSPETKRSLVK